MKIAIVGAGNVGKALGAAWKTAKHDVVYACAKAATRPSNSERTALPF